MAKRGRKPIHIEQKHFEGLCHIQATLREMSVVLGCSQASIERWVKRTYRRNFAEVFGEKRLVGVTSLRSKAWKLAEGGNVACLIFLAKQYLGMSDKVDVIPPGGVKPTEPEPDVTKITDADFELLKRMVDAAYKEKPLTGSRTPSIPGEPGDPKSAQPGDAQNLERPPTPPPVCPTDQT